MDWQTATNESVLKSWDAGEGVWSIEMGGLGPGYEQCIQLMTFEFLRAMLEEPFDFAGKADDTKAWRDYVDALEKKAGPADVINKLGPSGAQFGAAMNAAAIFARHGYAKGIEMASKDRRIQVRKHFPSLN